MIFGFLRIQVNKNNAIETNWNKIKRPDPVQRKKVNKSRIKKDIKPKFIKLLPNSFRFLNK